ncbi:MAG: branched-chain amino acid aminotransferase [Alphaproteobacteria bacterium]
MSTFDIPLDKRDGFIWLNGEFVPWADAKVHVLTHGLHYGSCVFEGTRAYNGKGFKLREHTERLHNSATIMDFEIPYSVEELIDAQNALLAKQGLKNAYLRPLAWRGSEALGVIARENQINVAIAAWEWPSYFPMEKRLEGLRLVQSKWARPAPNCAPTSAKAAGLYMICTLAKHEATDKGYDDALMLDYRGLVAESTGSNLFFIQDGKIHTPKPDCFLNGLTRQTVIGLAKKRGIEVIERHIKPEELADMEGAFITGTAIEVTPLQSIDDYKFEVGTIVRQMVEDYTALTQA